MYISLSCGLYFLSAIKSGDYNKDSCGGPSNWFIHKYKDPDFIELKLGDKVEITKPIGTMEYNFECYMYIFAFCNPVEDSISSIIYLKMMEFKNKVKVKPYTFSNKFYVFLTDTQITEYDHEKEALLKDDGSFYDNWETGGDLYYSEL